MKNILILLFMQLMMAAGYGQQINAVEYFINSDPGFGMGTAVSISAGTTIDEQFTIDITGETDGFHTLYVRAKDSNGQWSLHHRRHFYKSTPMGTLTPDVVSLEYFIDSDPGFGQGTLVSPTAGTQVDHSFVVDITGETDGFHTLYVRAKDSNGQWSLIHRRHFYKSTPMGMLTPDVVSLEYFIDSDPGFGQGTLVSPTAGAQVDHSFVVDITGEADGFHTLYVRAKDSNGQWSLHHRRHFYKSTPMGTLTPDVVGLEYFIDSDPGFGQGTLVSPTAGAQVDHSFVVDITGEADGFHTLYVRAKDSNGQWSLHHRRHFYKSTPMGTLTPDVVSLEYFIDSDPGFGQGTLVSPTAGTQVDHSFVVDITGEADGFHTLYVRAKDSNGQWSLHHWRHFYKNTVSTAHLPNIVRCEYFINSDPGFGQASVVSFTSDTTVDLTFTVDVSVLDTGVHVCYVRLQDANGQWSLIGYQVFEKRHCDDGVRNGDEEWVDCGGICGPCTDCNTTSVHVSDAPIADRTYIRASQFITSDGRVDPATEVIFQAANEVELQAEFEVKVGATFEVIIDDCDD